MMGQALGAFKPSLCWTDLQLPLPFDFLSFIHVFLVALLLCLVKIDLEFKTLCSGWISLRPLEF